MQTLLTKLKHVYRDPKVVVRKAVRSPELVAHAVIVLLLLVAAVNSIRFLDLAFYDEIVYIEAGRTFQFQALSWINQSPAYLALYKLLSFFTASNLALNDLHAALLIFLLLTTTWFAAWRLSGSLIVAVVALAYFLLLDVNLIAGLRVTLMGLVLINAMFLAMASVKSVGRRYQIALLFLAVLSYVRPEHLLAFGVVALVYGHFELNRYIASLAAGAPPFPRLTVSYGVFAVVMVAFLWVRTSYQYVGVNYGDLNHIVNVLGGPDRFGGTFGANYQYTLSRFGLFQGNPFLGVTAETSAKFPLGMTPRMLVLGNAPELASHAIRNAYLSLELVGRYGFGSIKGGLVVAALFAYVGFALRRRFTAADVPLFVAGAGVTLTVGLAMAIIHPHWHYFIQLLPVFLGAAALIAGRAMAGLEIDRLGQAMLAVAVVVCLVGFKAVQTPPTLPNRAVVERVNAVPGIQRMLQDGRGLCTYYAAGCYPVHINRFPRTMSMLDYLRQEQIDSVVVEANLISVFGQGEVDAFLAYPNKTGVDIGQGMQLYYGITFP